MWPLRCFLDLAFLILSIFGLYNMTLLCLDGQPLALNEIEKDLPAGSVKVLLETKWTFITQEVLFFFSFYWELSLYYAFYCDFTIFISKVLACN